MHRGARDDLRPVPAAALPGERLHRIVVRLRPSGPAVPRQRERVEHRPRPHLQVEVVKARSTLSQFATVAASFRSPRDGLPVTALTLAAAGSVAEAGAPPAGYRQCSRVGLTVTCSQSTKSRASTRVA
jgi:hypothetical protein